MLLAPGLGMRWILRRGSPKSGFRYTDDRGKRVTSRRHMDRIEALVIPPAWRDVHIATSPASAVQAL